MRNRARRGGMGKGVESTSAPVKDLEGRGLTSPTSEVSDIFGMMREGVKTLLPERGSRVCGDSLKPA